MLSLHWKVWNLKILLPEPSRITYKACLNRPSSAVCYQNSVTSILVGMYFCPRGNPATCNDPLLFKTHATWQGSTGGLGGRQVGDGQEGLFHGRVLPCREKAALRPLG